MRHQSALDLGGAEPMAGDVDDVVDATGDPVIAVGVAPAAIAGEVFAGIGLEVRVDEALVVAVDRAHHSRPGLDEAEVAGRGALQRLAVRVHDLRNDAEKRLGRRARLEPRRAGQRSDEDPAGFRLPPGIHDWAAAVAHHVVVPLPRLRIDRLAHGAKQPQRLARGFLHWLVAGLHQCPDRRRRGVDDVDLVLVAHLPEPRHAGIVRHALEHHGGGAVRQRPVDDVAVAGDPADVCGAPVNIALVVIEHVLVRHRHVDEVAAGGVQHALRLAGRARGVEDEQRVLGAHVLARTFRRHHLRGLVVPDVATGLHVDLGAGAPHDNHMIDPAGFLDRGVGVGLQRNLAPAAQALVGGNDDVGFAIGDAAGKRFR